jgi:hypothetical protein
MASEAALFRRSKRESCEESGNRKFFEENTEISLTNIKEQFINKQEEVGRSQVKNKRHT